MARVIIIENWDRFSVGQAYLLAQLEPVDKNIVLKNPSGAGYILIPQELENKVFEFLNY